MKLFTRPRSAWMNSSPANFRKRSIRSKKAAELDPKFTWAYTGMAAMAQNLGKPADALNYMKQAMQYVDNMTEREHFATGVCTIADRGLAELRAGIYATCYALSRGSRGTEQSFDLLYAVAQRAQGFGSGQTRSGDCSQGSWPRLNLAFISAFAGDFAGSEKEAHAALSINPKAAQGYLVLAEAQLGQGQVENANLIRITSLKALGRTPHPRRPAGLADLRVPGQAR